MRQTSEDRPDASGSHPAEPAVDDRDWPAQAADTIVEVVGTVRDKTTGPALTVARAVVYGLLIAVVGAMAAILLVIALVRFGDHWFPVWSVYLALGATFVIGGAVAWRFRAPRTPRDGNPRST